jgi:hypothetical protein
MSFVVIVLGVFCGMPQDGNLNFEFALEFLRSDCNIYKKSD